MVSLILLFLKPPLTFLDAEFGVRLLVRKDTAVPVLFPSGGCLHVLLRRGQGVHRAVGGAAGVTDVVWVQSSVS